MDCASMYHRSNATVLLLNYKKVLILYFHEILQTRQLKLPRKSLKVDHRCQPKSLSEKSTYSPCFHISLFLRTSLRKSIEKKIELVVRPDFQGVVLPQPDSRVFPDDEVPGRNHPVVLLPHQHKVPQVGHVARQDERVTL